MAQPQYTYDPVTQTYKLVDPMAPKPPVQGLGALYEAGGGDATSTPASTGTGFNQGVSPMAQNVGLGLMGIADAVPGITTAALGAVGSGITGHQAGAIGDAIANVAANQEAANNIGMATAMDAAGNTGTVSNQSITDAFDTATFGTTGAGLAGLAAMNAQNAAEQQAQSQQAAVANTAASVAEAMGVSVSEAADAAQDAANAADAAAAGGGGGDGNGGGGPGGPSGAGDESSHSADGNNSGGGGGGGGDPDGNGTGEGGGWYRGGYIPTYNQGGIASLANKVQSQGRGQDKVLVHMTPKEVAGLQALAMQHGGSLTINPRTGLVEAGFLSSILPMVAGAALAATGVGAPLAAGLVGGASYLMNPKQGLMGGLMAGLSAYGGAGLGAALAGPGAIGSTAMETAAMENVYMDPATKVMRPEFAAMGQQAQADAILNAQKAAAEQYAQQGVMDRLSQSASAIAKQPFDVTVNQLGGPMAALKTVGPAVATTALAAAGTGEEDQGKPPYEAKIRPFSYDPGRKTAEPGFKYRTGERGESTAEQTYFAPRYTPLGVYKPGQEPTYGTYSGGGITALKHGGMEEGGYVVAADVVSHLGNGSTKAGQKLLNRKLGGVPLNGSGDGMSDDIKTHIEGKQPARVADGEVYIPASVAKGRAKDLDRMMKRIRKAKTGRSSQAPEMNTSKFIPA